MFGIILLSVVAVMHVYVFWRAYSVPFLKHCVSRKSFISAGVLFWAVFLLGRFLGHEGTGAAARILELLGMTWMGVLFLAVVALLAVELLTGFGFFLPRLAPGLRGLGLALGGLLAIIALVQGLRPPVVQNYDVRLAGLSPELDGTVIVAMSDLHLGSVLGADWLEARIAQVQAEHPDLVVLLGDIFEGHRPPPQDTMQLLHGLSAPMGVWAVLGNHEFHGRADRDAPLMQYDGLRVLHNTWTEVRPSLVLAGVDDLTANHLSGERTDPIAQALTDRPPGATILLSHTPWQAEQAAAAGAGLMLSGHTHGGQIWPFGYLVQYAYPLLAGRYEINGMTVIVCRGTGTWGPRMRLWHPAEILRVTLHAK